MRAALHTIAAVVLSLSLPLANWAGTIRSYRVLHTFTGGSDGGAPASSLVLDGGGNLYGTAYSGGKGPDCPYQSGCGVLFELSPRANGRWKESVLFNFVKTTGGASTQQLLLGDAGDVFGATFPLEPGSPAYVFELTPGGSGWNFNPIYAPDGLCLVFDQTGDLYGCIGQGDYQGGAIGKLSRGSNGWTYTQLYSFCSLSGCPDGQWPQSPLSWDAHGNLYGTTVYGGITDAKCPWSGGCGVAFQMAPNQDGTWTYHVLHRFASFKTDGLRPYAGLTLDTAGNAYGATSAGGAYNCGMIFKLGPSAGSSLRETVLYNFRGADGCAPLFTPVLDSAGNLYGMAQGGDRACGPCGVIFKLAPQKSGKWKYSVVHTFHGADGADPYGVIVDRKGNLFGTTMNGGKYNAGVAFEITR
jgi:uncharacterized repeat protein (TIGR03803 family)